LSSGIVVPTTETSSEFAMSMESPWRSIETASQVAISMELVWPSTETLSRVAMSGRESLRVQIQKRGAKNRTSVRYTHHRSEVSQAEAD
jgi:hypothetical protein